MAIDPALTVAVVAASGIWCLCGLAAYVSVLRSLGFSEMSPSYKAVFVMLTPAAAICGPFYAIPAALLTPP